MNTDMKLFKVTWDGYIHVIGFYSPQFLEAPNEMKAMVKFITLYEKRSPRYSPHNIKVEEVCKVGEIIRYKESRE